MSLLTPATRLLHGLMVATIALMSVLVFINVVLRYGFNSNLGITEELARYLFVWLTFLGGISAFAKNSHVQVDTLLLRLSPKTQFVVLTLSDLATLFCCGMILIGCWQLTVLNMHNYLPVSEMPVGFMYFAGVPFSLCISIMLIVRLWRRLFCSCQGDQQ